MSYRSRFAQSILVVVALAAVAAPVAAAPTKVPMQSAAPAHAARYTEKMCKQDGGTVSGSGTHCILKSGETIKFENYTRSMCATDGGVVNELGPPTGPLCVLRSGHTIAVAD